MVIHNLLSILDYYVFYDVLYTLSFIYALYSDSVSVKHGVRIKIVRTGKVETNIKSTTMKCIVIDIRGK